MDNIGFSVSSVINPQQPKDNKSHFRHIYTTKPSAKKTEPPPSQQPVQVNKNETVEEFVARIQKEERQKLGLPEHSLPKPFKLTVSNPIEKVENIDPQRQGRINLLSKALEEANITSKNEKVSSQSSLSDDNRKSLRELAGKKTLENESQVSTTPLLSLSSQESLNVPLKPVQQTSLTREQRLDKIKNDNEKYLSQLNIKKKN